MSARGDIWEAADWPAGWTVRHLVETGSTNTDLLADVDAGVAGDRCVLVTDHQVAGRGRLDRRWDAPPGTNLLVSIAMAPVPAVPVEATHRVGIAALRAARSAVSEGVISLKWPNDLLLDDRKLAGILAQRSSTTDAVVVGLGLNIGWAPEAAARLGPVVTPAALLASILSQLDQLPTELRPTELGPTELRPTELRPTELRDVYRSELSTIGRRVRLELPTESVTGTAVDVDDRGRLLVELDGGRIEAYDAGDVVHLRTAVDGESSV